MGNDGAEGLLALRRAGGVTLAQSPAKGRIKDQAVAVSLGVTGLAYNTRLFKEKGWAAPTSWMDMADSKYKDKLVLV